MAIQMEWHRQRGAEFEDFFGAQVPSYYGNVEQEYWTIRKSAGLRDVSYFGKVRVFGKDRQRFLNGMLTNDVKSLESGKGIYALFLDVKGRVQADLKLYASPDSLLMVMQHYLKDRVVKGLDNYLISEDVRMQDVSDELAMFQILGPDAEKVLRAELPQELYSVRNVSIASIECSAIRLTKAIALVCPVGSSTEVMNTLDLPPIGMRAFEIFRIESGLPLMNRDIDETNLPQEARLDSALNFTKGCYLGQETIARLDAQGHVNKRLTGFFSESELKAGDRLYKDEKEVGKITSATRSLLLQRPFALGYVRREFLNEGEKLTAGEARVAVTVKEPPL